MSLNFTEGETAYTLNKLVTSADNRNAASKSPTVAPLSALYVIVTPVKPPSESVTGLISSLLD